MNESWKNKTVFEKQLKLNRLQLMSRYPPHWKELITTLSKFEINDVLELGCGVGSAAQLLKSHFPSITYRGFDYSEDAIEIAKENWGEPERFFVKDFWDLTEEDVQKYDCILESAVLDVMTNGDEALSFLLSLQPKSVYFQRIKFTDEPSYYETYKAYDVIETVQYYHNYKNFIDTLHKHNYRAFPIFSPAEGLLAEDHVIVDGKSTVMPTGFFTTLNTGDNNDR